MTASQAYNARAAIASGMKRSGYKLREIAQVLRLPSKWEAEKLLGRARRNCRWSNAQLVVVTGPQPVVKPGAGVLAYVAANPGRTCCEIASALDLRADTLSTTLRRMAAVKLVHRRRAFGQRRTVPAWRWYPGGAS